MNFFKKASPIIKNAMINYGYFTMGSTLVGMVTGAGLGFIFGPDEFQPDILRNRTDKFCQRDATFQDNCENILIYAATRPLGLIEGMWVGGKYGSAPVTYPMSKLVDAVHSICSR